MLHKENKKNFKKIHFIKTDFYYYNKYNDLTLKRQKSSCNPKNRDGCLAVKATLRMLLVCYIDFN